MTTQISEENIFEISVEAVQDQAINIIGRRLTEEELFMVKKGIESGLNFDLETVLNTAIREAVFS